MKQIISKGLNNVSRWMLLFTFCFTTFVASGVYKSLSVPTEKVWSGWMGNAWKTSGEAARLAENGQTLVQEFQANRSLYLDAMKMRILLPEVNLTVKGDEQSSPEIEAALYSADEGLVAEKTFDLTHYNSGDFLILPVQQKTTAGHSYKLEMRLKTEDSLKNSGYYVAFVKNTKEVPEMHCYIDGLLSEGNIAIAFRYYKTNLGEFYILLLRIAGLFLLQILILPWFRLWLTKDKKGIIRQITGLMFWIASPVVSFYLTQEMIGSNHLTFRKHFVAGLLIYYLAMGAVTALFRKVRISSGVFLCLMLLFPLANYYVYQFRGKPITIADLHSLGTAVEVAGEYTFSLSEKIGQYLILFWLYLVVMYYLQMLEFPRSGRMYAMRTGFLVVSVSGLLVVCTRYIDKTWIEGGDYWRLNEAYDEKGLLVMLSAQIDYMKVEMPEGYSMENIQAIADILKADEEDFAAENVNSSGQEDIVPENVIVIMNESLADLEMLGDIQTDIEVMPFLHSLNENVTKGQLHVPVFGGATSNTEYEFLTGHTTQFFPGDSIVYELFCGDPEYGLALQMKKQGYGTVAVHPSVPSNWNREKVYEEMGFDDFIHIENWETEYEKIRNYMSDWSAYNKLIALTEGKAEGEKLFIFCVTMQNHGGYTRESAVSFEPTVSLTYEQKYPLAEMYLSLVRESDAAFEKLINYYSDIKEPTMIVMFGDHQAAIEDAFYSELFKKDTSTMAMEEIQQRYVTPYVIWTNYKRGAKELDMSANYLGSYMLQEAGLELSMYNEFLLKLQKSIPIIGKNAVYTSEGKWNLPDELPKNYAEKMDIYRKIQYNIVLDRDHTVLELVS